MNPGSADNSIACVQGFIILCREESFREDCDQGAGLNLANKEMYIWADTIFQKDIKEGIVIDGNSFDDDLGFGMGKRSYEGEFIQISKGGTVINFGETINESEYYAYTQTVSYEDQVFRKRS